MMGKTPSQFEDPGRHPSTMNLLGEDGITSYPTIKTGGLSAS